MSALEELIDDLNVCEDENYLPRNELSALKQDGWRVYQLINGYIRYLRGRKAGASLVLHESSSSCEFAQDELDAMLSNDSVHDSTIQRFNDCTA